MGQQQPANRSHSAPQHAASQQQHQQNLQQLAGPLMNALQSESFLPFLQHVLGQPSPLSPPQQQPHRIAGPPRDGSFTADAAPQSHGAFDGDDNVFDGDSNQGDEGHETDDEGSVDSSSSSSRVRVRCPVCSGPGRDSESNICGVCYNGVYNDIKKLF